MAEGAPRLRTYASDMSRVIRARGETLTSIVSAEQRARSEEQKAPKPVTSTTRLLVVGVVAFILMGVGAIAFTVVVTTEPEAPELPRSLVFSNNTTVVEYDGVESLADVLAEKRRTAELLLGEIERFVVTRAGVPLTPQELARALGFPDTVAREVTGAMVGVHAFNYTQPFVIFEITTYDRTFNALLEWESLAARELGAFFAPASPPSPTPRLSFEDAIVRNLDVRVSEEAWPLIYTFPARSLLVVTTNEYTLREVVTRIGNASR